MNSYSTSAKVLHWLVAALILVQFPFGYFMPNLRRGEVPGTPMNLHISLGIVLLALIVVRLAWRLRYPVAPDAELPAWQRKASEGTHWAPYGLALATCLTGWFYASARGWAIELFWSVPLPPLVPEGNWIGRRIGGLHETLSWTLVGLAAVHIAAALVHFLVYKDRVVQRMLP